MQRVVATLTTLPGRYEKLKEALLSLHAQSRPLDAIYLTLPAKVTRLNLTYPPLPESITKLCTIVNVPIDYGPITKLLGALTKEDDPNTLIISVDDDMIYAPDLVGKLLSNAQLQPRSAIASGGYTFNHSFCHFMLYHNKFPWLNGWTFPHVPADGKRVEQLYGCSGVLYKRSYFENYDKLIALSQLTNDTFLNDDVVISAWLAKQKIPIYVFPNFSPCQELNKERDGNELSYVSSRMYFSMQRAYKQLEKYFASFPMQTSFTDSLFGTIVAIVVFILLLLLLIVITIYITYNREPINNSNYYYK